MTQDISVRGGVVHDEVDRCEPRPVGHQSLKATHLLTWTSFCGLSLPAQDLPLPQIFPPIDSLPASGLTPRTSQLDRFFWASLFYVFSFFIILFCLVPCGRLSWLLVTFWAHVNIVHRIVSYRRHQAFHQASLIASYVSCLWNTCVGTMSSSTIIPPIYHQFYDNLESDNYSTDLNVFDNELMDVPCRSLQQSLSEPSNPLESNMCKRRHCASADKDNFTSPQVAKLYTDAANCSTPPAGSHNLYFQLPAW